MRLNNIELKLSEETLRKLSQFGSLSNLDIFISKVGIESLKKNNILIHSSYDPIKESRTLISNLNIDKENTYLVIIFGVGLGYHLKILKEEYPNSIFIPIELDDDIALLYAKRENSFLITNYNLNDIYSIINFLDFTSLKDIKFLYLPSVYRLNKERYDKIGEEVSKIVKSKFTDLLTKVNFDKLWIKNIFLNIPHIIKYGTITNKVFSESFKEFMGRPFIVFGAGYSGYFLLEEIKKFQDKVVILSVDTALKTLVNSGIRPDVVFSLDSQFANIKDFFGIDTSELKLLSDVVVSPELIRNFKGKVFISKSSHIEILNGNVFEITNNVISYIEDNISYSLLGLESGGSVSTNLFHFALLMGGNPIFLVGVDLGFPYFVSHIKGSPNHEYFTLNSNLFSLPETKFAGSVLKEYIKLEGIKDKECITHKIMETYKLWFDSASDTSNLENVYNISDGVRLRGIKNMNTKEGKKFLASVLSRSNSIDKDKYIVSDVDKIDRDNLKNEILNIRRVTDELESDLSILTFRELSKQYPIFINLTSKSLFPYYRQQKSFDECKDQVINDIKYFKKVLDFVLGNLGNIY
ncbi:MAG: motility associated factor glycosyltransferase family protein [Brevinematia bacterium]